MYVLHIYETNMKVVVESRPFFAKKCAKNSKSSQACYEGKAYIAVVAFIHRHQMHGVGPLTMTNFVKKNPKIMNHCCVSLTGSVKYRKMGLFPTNFWQKYYHYSILEVRLQPQHKQFFSISEPLMLNI